MIGSGRLRPLLIAQAAFMLGFSSVVPFISAMAEDRFGLGAAATSAIVGVRVAAQQGMFLIGGAIADRWGARRLIVVGCLVRAVGLGLLATAPGVSPFVAGVVLTGLAGALFSPALESYVAAIDASRRAAARDAGADPTGPARRASPPPFAALAMSGEIGGIIGAIAGSAWMPQHAPAVALAASAVFAVSAIALALTLPARPASEALRPEAVLTPPARPTPVVRTVPLVLGASALLAIYTLLFSLVPLQLSDAGLGAGLVGAVPITLSLATLLLQWPISRVAERMGRLRAVRAALLVSAASAMLAAATAGLGSGSPALQLAALVAVTLGVGSSLMLGTPSAQSLLAGISDGRTATRLGALASAGGLCSLLLATASGAVVERFGIATAWAGAAVAPLLGCAIVGFASAGGFERPGASEPPSPSRGCRSAPTDTDLTDLITKGTP